MSCCGQARQRLRGADSNRPTPGHPTSGTQSPSLIYFEYIGKTGLTVTGPITGKRYRFAKTGAKVAVDSNDAPSLAVIPNLRQISNP